MKIGIDVDNTITTTLPILKEYCKKYNEEVIKRNLKIHEDGCSTMTLFDWTVEENHNFCIKYLEGIVTSAPVKPNAKEVINKIKEEGNEIYIITARSKPRIVDPYTATKKQLDLNGILYDEIIVNCPEKYDFCKENGIELMFDDEPQNINSISKIIPVIAFKEIHNEKCNGKNIIKVNNWNEAYEEYKKIKGEN